MCNQKGIKISIENEDCVVLSPSVLPASQKCMCGAETEFGSIRNELKNFGALEQEERGIVTHLLKWFRIFCNGWGEGRVWKTEISPNAKKRS